jgi:hypothetical protein
MNSQLQLELEDLIRLFSNRKLEVNIMAEVTVDIDITVSPAAAALAVDASGVPDTAEVGVAYSGVLVASGGQPPYTFTDVSASQTPPGSFPTGVQLNADGTITGTPTAAGDFAATVDVSDSAGASVTASVRGRVPSNKK